jgi:hypothetical protein
MRYSGTRVAIIGFFGTIAAALSACLAEGADDAPDRMIMRKIASGAGPAAIFRFGRDEATQRDVFGVIDPVLWRIQFYTLKDRKPAEVPLKERLKPVGDCLLHPKFRVWRVHQLPTKVVLQSQPEVTKELLLTDRDFTTRKLELDSSDESVRAVTNRPQTNYDEASPVTCGNATSFDKDKLKPFVAESDSATKVTGGWKTGFFEITPIALPAKAQAFLRKPIALAVPDRGLYSLHSVRELESARSDGKLFRHFLVTSYSATNPGFSTSVMHIVRRSENGKLDGTMQLNIGLTRIKTGHRYVAISSTGEVIIIGAADHEDFRFHICNFGSTHNEKVACTVDSDFKDNTASKPGSDADNLGAEAHPVTKPALWNKAFWFATQLYQIDTSKRPAKCDDWQRCTVGTEKIKWQPISELRFETGVYRKIGVPYAQSTPEQNDGRPSPDQNIKFPLKEPIPLQSTTMKPAEGADKPEHQQHFLISDIENTAVLGHPHVSVFGIDCSAFLSVLWGRGLTDTSSLVDEANGRKLRRVAYFREMGEGDAFLIALENATKHVVAYVGTRRASKVDSSLAALVVESSSSCGGVCWTYYDQSFFHGWAIVRNGKPTAPTSLADVPKNLPDWREMFAAR